MMELQWPLILFTTLVAWSAGLFGTQALMAVFGVGKRAQVPAWVASAVLLAAGGIAVFFHLEHWERIFNGFGHLTSGITQELIAIVVLAGDAAGVVAQSSGYGIYYAMAGGRAAATAASTSALPPEAICANTRPSAGA